jgi:hypothetical protein
MTARQVADLARSPHFQPGERFPALPHPGVERFAKQHVSGWESSK